MVPPASPTVEELRAEFEAAMAEVDRLRTRMRSGACQEAVNQDPELVDQFIEALHRVVEASKRLHDAADPYMRPKE